MSIGVGALEHVFKDGIIGSLSDPYNVGILVFLVIPWNNSCLDEQGRRLGCFR